ncbi:CHASE3 domain-containing protein [Hyphomicrobium sp.]|uniref:CHASE3 domain-containing protein n=1 Tax=Hyphomicrobium sp. TaxID=82 RepID=UPI002CB9E28C|nr:CHASE3 domain-containing protein [Hyphomicrobium sp.]HRN88803.1 CHASE3 domain-containing protein [Hyphomicrobium sp.]HRQ25474.1 CHASE3 domain-containing protein [Hyphomicrobium sp.]
MLNRLANLLRVRVPEVAGAALILIFGLTLWLGTRYAQQAEWVRHSLQVEMKLSGIYALLKDAELGQRSYILTGEVDFLQPFLRAKTELPDEISELKALLSDNDEQLEAFKEAVPIIERRLAYAEETISVRRQQGFDAAQTRILQRYGLKVTEELRDRFQALRKVEHGLLERREADMLRTVNVLAVAVVLAFLVTLFALSAWIFRTRRDAADIAKANKLLEETIADRDVAEMQIRQMQKVEAVGQLTGGIAHDFNNMLAVIMSGIGLAQKRLQRGQDGAEEFLNGALDGANRAATLVKRLLAFSRQQPLAPKAIDANKFVAGISELISRALGETIQMETILGGGLWLTHVDPVQLENSILNLCVNARDAMPDGGCLTVETANCHLDDRYARLHPGIPAGQYVLIAVTDTGTGMSTDILEKAFDPFFTTKDATKGTGLGLSQVYGFVKQSGGHVKIYSEIGQGSTVKIYLPRHYAVETERHEAVVQDVIPAKGEETVLLVEDDVRVLELTTASLRELGYTVLVAGSAREALVQLERDIEIDLLLTDIVMPEMNGRKLADAAIKVRPDLKVIFMTGFTKNAVVHNGVLDPGVNFLAKPFSLEELSAKIREALETKRA